VGKEEAGQLGKHHKEKQKMKKQPLLLMVLIVICIIFAWGTSKAQMYGEGAQPSQSTAGGATAQAVTATLNNPVFMVPTFSLLPLPPPPPPGVPAAPPPSVAGTAEAGFQIIYSRHVQAYRLPLSYAFTENFKMELGIPYIRKQLKGEYTGEELTASGLGDISVGAKYRWGDEAKTQWMTSISLKFPTAENREFENRHERLALGSGSYDFAVNQTVTSFVAENIMVVADVGYTFNTNSDYTETDNWGRNIKYENRAGNIFNYLIGAEYYTPVRKLVTYVNAAGLFMGRSHVKETNQDGLGWGDLDEDKKDSMKTLDLIAGVKYSLTEKIGVRLGFIVPVWTRFDPDAVDTQDREWMLDLGMAGRF
jgi:opacity protein-like surface antigen